MIFVDEHEDEANPHGIKGVGEIDLVGTAAAIANAVYHATSVRVRDLPIPVAFGGWLASHCSSKGRLGRLDQCARRELALTAVSATCADDEDPKAPFRPKKNLSAPFAQPTDTLCVISLSVQNSTLSAADAFTE
ncbi:hypothetical protein [Bradyrhizobium ivorense]|uniref:hypothetical protein n=1 Tax=Bradyrhizobium ivorense TaxID=2511166 RepID=UPI00155B2EBB|nr:hypothetical protein [Bradyrhizobium ivorense]